MAGSTRARARAGADEPSESAVAPIDAKGWPLGLWDRLDELADGLDDWERPTDAVPRSIRDERGLP